MTEIKLALNKSSVIKIQSNNNFANNLANVTVGSNEPTCYRTEAEEKKLKKLKKELVDLQKEIRETYEYLDEFANMLRPADIAQIKEGLDEIRKEMKPLESEIADIEKKPCKPFKMSEPVFVTSPGKNLADINNRVTFGDLSPVIPGYTSAPISPAVSDAAMPSDYSATNGYPKPIPVDAMSAMPGDYSATNGYPKPIPVDAMSAMPGDYSATNGYPRKLGDHKAILGIAAVWLSPLFVAAAAVAGAAVKGAAVVGEGLVLTWQALQALGLKWALTGAAGALILTLNDEAAAQTDAKGFGYTEFQDEQGKYFLNQDQKLHLPGGSMSLYSYNAATKALEIATDYTLVTLLDGSRAVIEPDGAKFNSSIYVAQDGKPVTILHIPVDANNKLQDVKAIAKPAANPQELSR